MTCWVFILFLHFLLDKSVATYIHNSNWICLFRKDKKMLLMTKMYVLQLKKTRSFESWMKCQGWAMREEWKSLLFLIFSTTPDFPLKKEYINFHFHFHIMRDWFVYLSFWGRNQPLTGFLIMSICLYTLPLTVKILLGLLLKRLFHYVLLDNYSVLGMTINFIRQQRLRIRRFWGAWGHQLIALVPRLTLTWVGIATVMVQPMGK